MTVCLIQLYLYTLNTRIYLYKMANTPHGGALKDLLVRDAQKHDQLLEESRTLQDIFLTEVSLVHVEGSLTLNFDSDNYVILN